MITVEARRENGSHYTITRRGGYDLAYDTEVGRTERVYTGVSTDIPISTTKPAHYETAVTVFRGGSKSSARYASTLIYFPDETMHVGACDFHTIHFSEEVRRLDGATSVTTNERWFSPDLNMTLRLIEGRREPDGSVKRLFEAHATTIAKD